MKGAAVFDEVSRDYDREFTFTPTGLLMRAHVRKWVSKSIPMGGKLNILEINCGTGEDSIWFAAQGHQVTGTDLSEGMVDAAKHKQMQSAISESKLKFERLGFEELHQLDPAEKFDLIFSNFGGMNCVEKAELSKLIEVLNERLKPGGKFIPVVMPRFCSWETFYFLIKGKFKSAFRRLRRKPVSANVGAGQQPTWYYSPRQIKRLCNPHFKTKLVRPVGIGLPPSYLDPFFARRPRLLNLLNRFENFFGKFSIFSGCADHFIAVFEKSK